MKFKIYLNLIFGVVAFVIGLIYYLNHEYKIGNFIILVAVFAEIKAVAIWYFSRKKNDKILI